MIAVHKISLIEMVHVTDTKLTALTMSKEHVLIIIVMIVLIMETVLTEKTVIMQTEILEVMVQATEMETANNIDMVNVKVLI